MTTDPRTPEEIEREIEVQRSALTSNLDDLQQRFSVETIVREVGDQLRLHGGDIGRSLSAQVKANPIPLALTGIGLAWMMMGGGQKPVYRERFYDDPEEDYRRSRLDRGLPYTPPVNRVSDQVTSPAWARGDTNPVWAEDETEGTSTRDKLASGAGAVRSGLSSAASTAAGVASGAASTVAGAASTVAGAASGAASSVAGAAHSARSGIASAGSRIAAGTETLSEEGRKRVIAARQKALDMSRSTMSSVSGGTDAAYDLYDRQPLVIGALALAVGAALGGALPRTRTEDEYLGAHSDNLIHEAERIYEEEKAKVTRVAQSVADEVKNIAAETKSDLDTSAPAGKTAAQTVEERAEAAIDRVADAAKTAAKNEKLGHPKA